MTLLLFQCFQTDWVLVTSDTRQIYKELDNVWDMSEEKTLINDAPNKVEQLTKYTLICIGGIGYIGDRWKDFMKKNVKEHYYLDDCKYVFEQASQEILEIMKFDKIFEKYALSLRVGMYLAGFYKDGTTGFLKWEQGEIFEEKVEKNYHFNSMFAPSQDINLMKDKLLDISKIPIVNGNMLESILGHFALIQALVTKIHPDEVSTKFLAHALIKDEKGDIIYQKTDSDVTELRNKINM
jgi:hypothetical protein